MFNQWGSKSCSECLFLQNTCFTEHLKIFKVWDLGLANVLKWDLGSQARRTFETFANSKLQTPKIFVLLPTSRNATRAAYAT